MYIMYMLCFCTLCSYPTCEWPEFYVNKDMFCSVLYMSAHVLLNLLNELGKKDKMRGLPSISSLFRNEFNKFNNIRA